MPEPDDFVERVLACVRAIPPGRVMTYGDVAEYAGVRSPRSVGRVLARYGDGVPWHRVLLAGGRFAPHLEDEQRQLLLAEGVTFRSMRGGGDTRIDLAEHRWDGS